MRDRAAETAYFVLCKPWRLCYTQPVANPRFRSFLGSSAVEHSTVNRMVAGSNPARGATSNQSSALSRDGALSQFDALTSGHSLSDKGMKASSGGT